MKERSRIINDLKEASYLYGGEDLILTDEDIKLLKQGKIFNFFFDDEYGFTLRFDTSEEAQKQAEENEEEDPE